METTGTEKGDGKMKAANMATEIMAAEENQEYKGCKVSELRKVFEAIQNADDWKAPWAASVPHQIVGIICKAVEFFHADRVRIVGTQRITGMVVLEGRGYQA